MTEPAELSAISDAKSAVTRGDLFAAYDIAAEALHRFPQSAALQYLVVLALARSGATQSAQALYEHYDLAAHGNVDQRSLGARLLKDLAFEQRPAAPDLLLRAANAYHRIYQQTGEYFPAINAATLFFLAGDRENAERIASTLIVDPALEKDDGYYAAATLAEAALLLGRKAEALEALARARSHAKNDFSALATTRKQLARILASRGADAGELELLEALTIPQVAFYCGHMVTATSGVDSGWEARLRVNLESAIEQHRIGVAFGGLACGADILIAETFLQKGIELNVVLPFKLEDYRRHSVEPGGAGWTERFQKCLDRAAAVTFASLDDYVGDPAQFSYGSAVAMGMAKLRASHLQTGSVQLAASDGSPASGEAGTAVDIAEWQRYGGKTVLIPFERPVAENQIPAPTIEPRVGVSGGFLSRHLHSIIFTDVHGFSRIPESRMPQFWNGIMKRLADTIERSDVHVRYRNTWGDALFLIVDDICVAADLALSLHDCVTADDAAELGLKSVPQLRIALNHAPLFEGYDPVRKERTFFGSEVSRTASIEPVTPLGTVYATESFAAILALRGDDRFACNYVGRVDLPKGYGAYRMYRLSRRVHGH